MSADLRRHYKTGRIAYSLRTKSIRDARVRAMSDAAKLDRNWHSLCISSKDLPGRHLLAGAGMSKTHKMIPLFSNQEFLAAQVKAGKMWDSLSAVAVEGSEWLIYCFIMKRSLLLTKTTHRQKHLS